MSYDLLSSKLYNKAVECGLYEIQQGGPDLDIWKPYATLKNGSPIAWNIEEGDDVFTLTLYHIFKEKILRTKIKLQESTRLEVPAFQCFWIVFKVSFPGFLST